ncbi:MAG TPA: TerB family tellurite resistance protein [Stenotrophobium sp.]|nr:TerB family tellurite resistance protein [Stenotrophobium sp.]
MKFSLQKFFQSSPEQGPPDERMQRLAVTQLLLEIARADMKSDAVEIAAIRKHLAQAYDLDDAALDELMQTASERVGAAVSLYDTVNVINQRLDAEGKARLVRALWQVAYADGHLDPYEEAMLRRLADLLYVSHDTFIQEKLKLLDG